jgi:hypothetical protein
MSELRPVDVRSLAQALNLALEPDDVEEVTHRVNGFLHALAPLSQLRLGDVEPLPFPPESQE